MRFLIDTHCWLWWFLSPERLSKHAIEFISNSKNDVVFSVVSTWEIAIKVKLGKLKLPSLPKDYIPKRLTSQRMTILAIENLHALRTADLPFHHNDPFDRLLIAQAQVEQLPILTTDPLFSRYEIEIIR